MDEKARFELEQKYDQFVALCNEAEESLLAIAPPVYEHVEISDGELTGRLGLSKTKNNNWHVCWAEKPDSTTARIWKPLGECPVDTRLALIKHLPKLAEVIHIAAEQRAKDLQRGIAELRQFLAEHRRL